VPGKQHSFKDGLRAESGVKVRYQFAFQTGNHVFQPKLLLFQAANSQLIDMRVFCQFDDGRIEISMLHPELSKARRAT